MKKYLLLIGLILFAFPVSAAQFIHQKDGSYSLKEGDTIREDAYIGAKNASIDGTVEGDVYAGGNEIKIRGSVTENLFAAGKTISLSGIAGHNVYAAGQTMEIAGAVHGDVIVAGDTLTIREGAVIDGEVFFFGNELHVNGEVKGGVHFFGNALTFNNGKAASINMHGNTLDLIAANISGYVTYEASRELSKDNATVIGGAVTKSPERMDKVKDAPMFGFNIAFFLMGLVMVMLAVWLFGKEAAGFVMDAVARPGRTGVIGILALIAIPIVSIILMITVIGLPLGVLLLLTYGILLIASSVLASILVGAVLAKWIKKEYIVDYKWAFAGFLVLTILDFVPLMGWIPGMIAFLCMFGVLILMLEKKFHKN